MITVRLESQRAVIEGFDAVSVDIIRRTQFLVRRHTLEIANKAKLRAPKDRGVLTQSIDTAYEDDGLTGIAGVTPPGSAYAAYQEFGTGIYATGPGGSHAKKIPWVYYDAHRKMFFTTSGNRPRPFLLPSFNEQAPQFVDAMRAMLRQVTR